MAGVSKYPDELKRKVIEEYASIPVGQSTDYLVQKYGIPRVTMQQWLKDSGAKRPHSYKELRETHCSEVKAVIRSKDSIVLAIPDMHHPFCHRDALDFLRAVKSKFHPTTVICLGDEVDFHSISRYPSDPDGYSPGHELAAAIESLIPFYKEFPEVLVCVSNHTIRPQKRMKEVGIPKRLWAAYSTMLNAPDGWRWKDHWEIDGVRYMHGDLAKGGKHGWTMNSEVFHKSCVVGHWHSRGGVVYDSKMLNMNAGCLIDDTAYAFEYARGAEKRPNLGCGIVINGEVAHFIPMRVNAENRWIGRI